MSANVDRTTVRQLLLETLSSARFRRATFAGPARGEPTPWKRVTVRPLQLRGRPHLQFSYFDGRKTRTNNFPLDAVEPPLEELLSSQFAGIHLSSADEEIDLRTTKKGQIQLGRRRVAVPPEAPMAHNRVKQVPLPEGRADRLLEAMGIVTRTGRVRPTMRDKFTQINEFLKQLLHLLDDSGLRGLGRPIEILDCGCGASYLTLAVHHYLNEILHLPARILGVDVNEEVIRKSMERADRLRAEGLSFACGRIGELQTRADLVLALHACDTATDDALAQAVRSQARLILGVPCCHHHLNDLLRAEGEATVLRPILRHGILRQRTADLVTDAFRALLLRLLGYRTEVVEFVSLEHTARNLMIRAVRGAPVGEPALVREYLALKQFWNVTPYLERLLAPQVAPIFDRLSSFSDDCR